LISQAPETVVMEQGNRVKKIYDAMMLARKASSQAATFRFKRMESLPHFMGRLPRMTWFHKHRRKVIINAALTARK
jgi:hypothetical protein